MARYSLLSTMIKFSVKRVLSATLLLASSYSVASSSSMYDYFYNIEQSNYRNSSEFVTKTTSMIGKNLMERGLKEEARSIGIQAGKYWAQQEYKSILQGDKESGGQFQEIYRHLNEVHDISPYMLRYGQYYVMPPVVTETRGSKSYKDMAHKSFTVAERTFHIRSEPRFVDSIPTWRDYVKLNAKKPQIFSKGLLPSTEEEKVMWQENFEKGWLEGVESAKLNFDLQFARFVFDAIGIQRYFILQSAGYISEPKYTTSKHPVSGNDKMMHIGNEYVSISVVPTLEHDYKKWRVIPELPVLEELLPSRYHQILQWGTGL